MEMRQCKAKLRLQATHSRKMGRQQQNFCLRSVGQWDNQVMLHSIEKKLWLVQDGRDLRTLRHSLQDSLHLCIGKLLPHETGYMPNRGIPLINSPATAFTTDGSQLMQTKVRSVFMGAVERIPPQGCSSLSSK